MFNDMNCFIEKYFQTVSGNANRNSPGVGFYPPLPLAGFPDLSKDFLGTPLALFTPESSLS